MAKTLFKIAAQNLGATVWDTNDLSTIRGSSLTLLQMPELLGAHLQASLAARGIALNVIKAAASELVFEVFREGQISIKGKPPAKLGSCSKQKIRKAMNPVVTELKAAAEANSDATVTRQAEALAAQLDLAPEHAPILAAFIVNSLGSSGAQTALSDDDIAEIRAEIDAFLAAQQGAWPLDLMHFASAAAPSTPKHDSDLGHLDADLRHQQMQRLDCALPLGGREVCKMSLGQAAGGKKEKALPVSLSVHRRRKVGRSAKQAFYEAALRQAEAACEEAKDKQAIADGLRALDRIEQFASDFSQIVKGAPGSLSLSAQTNLAVVHMDGNSFGRLIAGKSSADVRQFAIWMEQRKAVLLARILVWAQGQDLFFEESLRFETLLWGGDEFSFVLPSWAVFGFLNMLREDASDWRYGGQDLSFAIGVAIAKHKTPIRAVSEAAQGLVDLAKGISRDHSLVQVNVYESVDVLALSPEAFREQLFGGAIAPRELALALDDLPAWASAFAKLSAAYGRSGLYRLCLGGQAEPDQIAEHARRVGLQTGALDNLAPLSERMGAALMNMLLLWDYFEPELEPSQEAAQ